MSIAIRWWAASAIVVVASGFLGAVPAVGAERSPTIDLPTVLVVGDPNQASIIGEVTVTGCPTESTVPLEITRLDADGEVRGGPLGFRTVEVGEGVFQLGLSTPRDAFFAPGTLATGSLVIEATCFATGESAKATLPVMQLQIALPARLTVLSLLTQQPTPDALISGCPGSIESQSSYSYPLGHGAGEVTLPIDLVPQTNSNSDGSLPYPLDTFQDWLGSQRPVPGGSILITATCFVQPLGTPIESVTTATVTIPAGDRIGEPAPPALSGPGDPASAVDPVVTTGAPAGSAEALAATGDPVAVQLLVGMTALLLGAGAALVSRRRRVTAGR